MARKPERKKAQALHPRKRDTRQAGTVKTLWLSLVILALAAGLLTCILLPRLQFAGALASSVIAFYAVCIAILVLGISSSWGRGFTTILKYVLPLLFLAILASNMSLQFKWLNSNLFLELLSTWLVIPFGILWAMFLSQVQITRDAEIQSPSFFATFLQPPYLIGLFLVALTGGFLLFYRLGYYDFWEDENLVINAAIGLRDQGAAYLAEGYDRAWAHSWMITQSIGVFGESEWSARLPSAVFGMLFIFVSCFVFFRWFRLPMVAICIPLICLLTDEFLILFRYARMYAPLIPFFLMAMYLTHRFLVSPLQVSSTGKPKFRLFGFDGWLALGAVVFLVAATHFHLLASIGFLVAYALLVALALTTRLTPYLLFVGIGAALAAVVVVLGLAEVPTFKFVLQAIRRITRPDAPEYKYYEFLFTNGLPQNVTLMTLIAGTGLFFNTHWDIARKRILGMGYMIITFALIFMVYLMADTGRDYRYISHIVPFVIGLQLLVLYHSGSMVTGKSFLWIFLALPLVYTLFTFSREYKEVYVRHPWSPLYSVVYADIRQQYKPGEAILYQNMKTYYLDPQSLAGDKAVKMGKRKEMSLDQFKAIFNSHARGWVVFDTHKSYHVDQEIQKFIARRAEKRHGYGTDDTGVEVYYFNNESRLAND